MVRVRTSELGQRLTVENVDPVKDRIESKTTKGHLRLMKVHWIQCERRLLSFDVRIVDSMKMHRLSF